MQPSAFEIEGRVYASVPVEYVFKSALDGSDIRGLGSDDCIVLLLETNDAAGSMRGNSQLIFDHFRIALRSLCHTNMALCTIPYRYDLPQDSILNLTVQRANVVLRRLSSEFNNVSSIDLFISENVSDKPQLAPEPQGKTFVSGKTG